MAAPGSTPGDPVAAGSGAARAPRSRRSRACSGRGRLGERTAGARQEYRLERAHTRRALELAPRVERRKSSAVEPLDADARPRLPDVVLRGKDAEPGCR